MSAYWAKLKQQDRIETAQNNAGVIAFYNRAYNDFPQPYSKLTQISKANNWQPISNYVLAGLKTPSQVSNYVDTTYNKIYGEQKV